MARQHYLPAAYVGGFSPSSKSKRRDRPVWCLRRGQELAWQDRPRNLLFGDDLYVTIPGVYWAPEGTTDQQQRDVVDWVWGGYESHLPAAIARLAARDAPLPANMWIRTLVPFVTGLFVRHPNYFEQYGPNRWPRWQDEAELSTATEPWPGANSSRLMELQRLLAPICAARWMVIHAEPSTRYITNDLALAPCIDSTSDLPYGWTIPLTPTATLSIIPTMRGPVIRANEGGGFDAVIEHHDSARGGTVDTNRALAWVAHDLIVGAGREDVEQHADLMAQPPHEPWAIMSPWAQIPSWSRRAHEFEWHRLATVVTRGWGPERPVDLQDWNPSTLASAWCPPLMLPMNSPEYSTGLSGNDDGLIELDLSVPDDIEDSPLY